MTTGRAGADRFLAVLAAAVVALALLEFGVLGLLAPLENRLSDALVRLHVETQRPDPEIVIVDIDEHTLEKMAPIAGRYPWSRAIHAELVEGIGAYGPKAIIFDILFSDPNLQDPAGDDYLIELAHRDPRLFFPLLRLQDGNDAQGVELARYGSVLGIEPSATARQDARVALLLPLPGIAETGRIGAINFHEDPEDGVGRRYHLNLDVEGWRLPSLPARVAGALGYPLPVESTMRLHWRGPALSYTRIPYFDLFEDLGAREPAVAPDRLRDKIVIIGTTATGLHDLRTTPVASLHPGVEILATAIDNLKNGDPLREVPAVAAPLLTFMLIGVLFLAFRRFGNPLPIGLGLVATTPLLLGAAYGALALRWVVPALVPLLFAWLFYGAAALRSYLRERRAREHSVQVFSRFLDPRVVRDLVSQGESMLTLSGESRTVTVLFSDIRGFTTLSERSTPEQIVALLNNYFSRQVKVIFNRNGTMDKFIGDAIMAFWGAPVANPNQAADAVKAALDMCDALEEFRQELGPEGEGFDVGIGIHTGPAVVGFIGSENRLDYTAIGDAVNLASRIEGQTKGIARVLVSGETRRLCGEAFDFTDRGSYKVKGREQPVQLFEPKRKPTECAAHC